jgi:uncharacterized LabA/DUF88 family protein
MAGDFFKARLAPAKFADEAETKAFAEFVKYFRGDNRRIGLFIDGANMYSTMRKLRWDMDYQKLFDLFNSRGDVVYAGYYTAVLANRADSGVGKLIDWLDYHSWNVVTKPAKEYTTDDGERRIKGNMDMELAIDALIHSSHLDHVVLGTGDGDFKVLVQELQRKGIGVTVLSSLFRPEGSSPICSDELRRQANFFVKIEVFQSSLIKRR